MGPRGGSRLKDHRRKPETNIGAGKTHVCVHACVKGVCVTIRLLYTVQESPYAKTKGYRGGCIVMNNSGCFLAKSNKEGVERERVSE